MKVESARGYVTSDVTTALRRAILSGDLQPGDHVRQELWAKTLDVSRLPVREALKILTAEGVLVHDPRKGYFVAQLSVEEMRQIYRMRGLLEPDLVKTARWPTGKELDALRRDAQRGETAFESRNAVECLEAERAFDFAVYDLSPLHMVVNEVKRLWDLITPYRLLVFSEPEFFHHRGSARIAGRHDGILRALEAQDRDRLHDALLESHDVMIGYYGGTSLEQRRPSRGGRQAPARP